jgi:hypothetical protein
MAGVIRHNVPQFMDNHVCNGGGHELLSFADGSSAKLTVQNFSNLRTVDKDERLNSAVVQVDPAERIVMCGQSGIPSCGAITS